MQLQWIWRLCPPVEPSLIPLLSLFPSLLLSLPLLSLSFTPFHSGQSQRCDMPLSLSICYTGFFSVVPPSIPSPFLLTFSFPFLLHPSPHYLLSPSLPSPSPCSPPPPIPASPVMMGVTQETTYQRRVCVRTAILCVDSVWDLDQPTVPPVETQGDVL